MGGPTLTRGSTYTEVRVGTLSSIEVAIHDNCPGLMFSVKVNDEKIGMVTVVVSNDVNRTELIGLHRVMRDALPAGVDYEIETLKGTYTSRHTLKSETPIPSRRIKKDKNRKKYGAPWGF